MYLTEKHIYGSSRLGMDARVVDMFAAATATDNGYFEEKRGEKRYELSNHLGNVLVVLSDQKLATLTSTNSLDYYTAEVLSYNDYYPFGAPMHERSGSNGGGEYRYGFNGKELDKEGMGGGGSSYDYGFRIYNSALGKFLSVDPFVSSYQYFSPYQFAANMPIVAIDLDGLEAVITINSPWYASEIKKAIDSGDVQRAIYLAIKSVVDAAPNDWARKVFGDDYAGTFNWNEANLDGLTVYSPSCEVLFTLEKTTSGINDRTAVTEDHSDKSWYDPILEFFGMIDEISTGDAEKTEHDGGGFMFTSSSGQNQEKRIALDPSQVEGPINLDDLMGVVGAAKSATGSAPSNVLQGLSHLVSAAEIGKSLGDNLGGNQKGNIESNDIYICPTCNNSFSAKDTTDHNISLGRTSGPFKPAENEKK